MSTTTMTGRKPGFQLPMHKWQSSKVGGQQAQIKGAGLGEESTARVLLNTPSLQKLEEILKRPIP